MLRCCFESYPDCKRLTFVDEVMELAFQVNFAKPRHSFFVFAKIKAEHFGGIFQRAFFPFLHGGKLGFRATFCDEGIFFDVHP